MFLVENLENEMLIGDIEIPNRIREGVSEHHLRELAVRRQNIEDIRAIQKVISVMEESDLTLDEVLARVLSFYRRFVPYR